MKSGATLKHTAIPMQSNPEPRLAEVPGTRTVTDRFAFAAWVTPNGSSDEPFRDNGVGGGFTDIAHTN
jgi:hypothetical protein